MNSLLLRYFLIFVILTILVTESFAQRTCVTSPTSTNNTVLEPGESSAPAPEVIVIPVIVHIIYNNQDQNISNDRVYSQLEVLNRDFRKKNSDASFIPTAFRELAADAHIEFRLATIDPFGLPTTGINRVHTDATGFTSDDKVKFHYSGGQNAWNRDEYLNIWVANLSGGIMGYASTPGCEPAKDGVVLHYKVFGTSADMAAPFNKGRTAVHEIGHWLGLRHIWGDAECGDDKIEDTPPQRGPTRGCPSGVVATCTSGSAGNMYMNFMDFTNDECTSMFTYGQVAKMQGLFAKGAARNILLNSRKAEGSISDYAQVENIVSGNTSVYPNPAKDILNIRLSTTAAVNENIRLFNHSGQLLKTVIANASVVQVDISSFAAGVYFLKVGQQPGMKILKVKG